VSQKQIFYQLPLQKIYTKKIKSYAMYILNQGGIMKKNSNWQTPHFFAGFKCQNPWSELNLSEHTSIIQRGKLQ